MSIRYFVSFKFLFGVQKYKNNMNYENYLLPLHQKVRKNRKSTTYGYR